MKLRMLCACLIALLFFSAAAFAEILPWGTGETSGNEGATASHGNPYDYNPDSGDSGYYTTVDGYFTYYYEASATASASLNLVDGWGRTTAIASASAGTQSAYKSFDYTSEGSWGPETDGPWVDDHTTEPEFFAAYTGVSAYWDVVAECQIEEGTYSDAYANASVYAQASMWP